MPVQKSVTGHLKTSPAAKLKKSLTPARAAVPKAFVTKKTPVQRAKAKLTNQPLATGKLTKANPLVDQGCGAFKCRSGGRHSGVDILAAEGTKLYAPGKGRADIGYLPSYGKTVLIYHGDSVQTRLAHLSDYLIKNGTKVTTTTAIAKVGRTGNTPLGGQTHLHFEIIVDGKKINPSDVFHWEQDK